MLLNTSAPFFTNIVHCLFSFSNSQYTNCHFACRTLTSLSSVTAYGFDLVRGAQTLELVKSGFPAGKYLFAGVVDGRNIWADDLAASLSTLQALEAVVGKGKHMLSSVIGLDLVTTGNL